MLRIASLTKRFHVNLDGASIGLTAFEDVSLSLSGGSLVAVVGESGRGKSSLLRCVYRTYLPTSGSVWFQSEALGALDLASAPDRAMLWLRRREMAYIPQFLRVAPRISALDAVAERLLPLGEPLPDARDQAAVWLERLRIPRRLWDAYPSTFSGGEQQRVNVARAVVPGPRLLLADEPTASLDPDSAEIVAGVLGELKGRGAGILGVFHDRALVIRIADEMAEMTENGLALRRP